MGLMAFTAHAIKQMLWALIWDNWSRWTTSVSLDCVNKPYSGVWQNIWREKKDMEKHVISVKSFISLDSGRRLYYLTLSESKNPNNSQERMLKSVLDSRNTKRCDAEAVMICYAPPAAHHWAWGFFSPCRTEPVILNSLRVWWHVTYRRKLDFLFVCFMEGTGGCVPFFCSSHCFIDWRGGEKLQISQITMCGCASYASERRKCILPYFLIWKKNLDNKRKTKHWKRMALALECLFVVYSKIYWQRWFLKSRFVMVIHAELLGWLVFLFICPEWVCWNIRIYLFI